MNVLSGITEVNDHVTHLVTAENVNGEKGRGGMARIGGEPQPEALALGQDWCVDGPEKHPARELGEGNKVRPCLQIKPLSTVTLLNARASGAITHIWITTTTASYRDMILRFYWDDESTPSVECPVGDFFGCAFAKKLNITAIPINANPTSGLNCFFPMPFRSAARITVENRRSAGDMVCFYAISWEERPVGEREGYFHAQFRRQNPVKYGDDYVILDGVKGKGHYVGTQLGWQQNNSGWWGEGEVKMFIDGDDKYASYVGTGTEDYFGGAWGFGGNFTAPFLGYQDTSATPEHGDNQLGDRHSMYRYHLADPIHFQKDLRVTIQALGWRDQGRFLPLQDDICSVAYWYQLEPHAPFPQLGDRNALEVI